jgi:heme A synthase
VSGAVTALGDTLFPSTSMLSGFTDDLSPSSHIFIRLRLWHPVLALITSGFLLTICAMFARLGDRAIRRRSGLLLTLLVAQLGLGFANVALLAPLPLQLAHLLLADGIWILLVMLGFSTLTAHSATHDLFISDPIQDSMQKSIIKPHSSS